MKPRPTGTDGDVRDVRAGILIQHPTAARLSNLRVEGTARRRLSEIRDWCAQPPHSDLAVLMQSGNFDPNTDDHRPACPDGLSLQRADKS